MHIKLFMEGTQPKEEVKEAYLKISNIRDEIYTMGANDSEIPEINVILENLKEGSLEPKEAVRKANEIYNRKSDYH